MGDEYQLKTVAAHVKNETLPQDYQQSWMDDLTGFEQLQFVNKVRLNRTKRFQSFQDDENPNAFGIKYDITNVAGQRLFHARDRRVDPIDKAFLDARDESNKKGVYHIYDRQMHHLVHTVNCESSFSTMDEQIDIDGVSSCLRCLFSCCVEDHDYSDWNDIKVCDAEGTIGSVTVDKVRYKSFAAGNEYDLVLSVKSEWGEPMLSVVHDSTKRVDDARSDVWDIYSSCKTDQLPVGNIRFKYEENENERDFYIKIMCYTLTFPDDIDVKLKAVLLCTVIYLDNKVFNRVVWRRAGEIEA